MPRGESGAGDGADDAGHAACRQPEAGRAGGRLAAPGPGRRRGGAGGAWRACGAGGPAGGCTVRQAGLGALRRAGRGCRGAGFHPGDGRGSSRSGAAVFPAWHRARHAVAASRRDRDGRGIRPRRPGESPLPADARPPDPGAPARLRLDRLDARRSAPSRLPARGTRRTSPARRQRGVAEAALWVPAALGPRACARDGHASRRSLRPIWRWWRTGASSAGSPSAARWRRRGASRATRSRGGWPPVTTSAPVAIFPLPQRS